eukprot:CCRYP_012558-RA/>CCRYP_012558-RA protein AED:0.48 eAED:0.48 QI:0/-1/0/1/-1/0/1/0/5
MGWGK